MIKAYNLKYGHRTKDLVDTINLIISNQNAIMDLLSSANTSENDESRKKPGRPPKEKDDKGE